MTLWLRLYQAYGGDNSPYVFVDLDGRSSWDVFSDILEKAQVDAIQPPPTTPPLLHPPMHSPISHVTYADRDDPRCRLRPWRRGLPAAVRLRTEGGRGRGVRAVEEGHGQGTRCPQGGD